MLWQKLSQLLTGGMRRRRNTLKSFIHPKRGVIGQTGMEMKHTIDDRDPTNTN